MAVKDDIYEIADSTDWLATPIPSLSAVDSALRCQVCKDFYTTPMLTSCSHTFCSLCIRRCLQSDHKCPTCRADDQEMRLRKNGAMEELVEAFQRARPEVLEFAKRPPVVVQRSISPKRKRESVDDNGSPIKKRTRAGRKATASQASQSVVLDSEEDDDEYVPGMSDLSMNQTITDFKQKANPKSD
jgi:E3 ubiquitin-protein ligase RAD18